MVIEVICGLNSLSLMTGFSEIQGKDRVMTIWRKGRGYDILEDMVIQIVRKGQGDQSWEEMTVLSQFRTVPFFQEIKQMLNSCPQFTVRTRTNIIRMKLSTLFGG